MVVTNVKEIQATLNKYNSLSWIFLIGTCRKYIEHVSSSVIKMNEMNKMTENIFMTLKIAFFCLWCVDIWEMNSTIFFRKTFLLQLFLEFWKIISQMWTWFFKILAMQLSFPFSLHAYSFLLFYSVIHFLLTSCIFGAFSVERIL